MKIRSLLLMLVIFLSTATIANADGAHDHAPLFGGKIFVAKDIDVELVAKNDLVQVCVWQSVEHDQALISETRAVHKF